MQFAGLSKNQTFHYFSTFLIVSYTDFSEASLLLVNLVSYSSNSLKYYWSHGYASLSKMRLRNFKPKGNKSFIHLQIFKIGN